MVNVISGLYLRSSGVGGVSRMRSVECDVRAGFPELRLRRDSYVQYQSDSERCASLLYRFSCIIRSI